MVIKGKDRFFLLGCWCRDINMWSDFGNRLRIEFVGFVDGLNKDFERIFDFRVVLRFLFRKMKG